MASITRGAEPAAEEDFLGALYKGGELLAAGKIVEAREHLEKAHHLEPKNEKAQNLLGLTYFKLGLYEDAARIYELLVRDNPVDPTLRVNLGLVYLKTNNLVRCIKEFETATDLDPAHQKAHNYLGLALAQAGEYAKAREHFHAAGSEAMAEKMTKALMARAEAEEQALTVKSPPPATLQAVTGGPAVPITAPPPPAPEASAPPPPPLPEPPGPPVQDEGTWDVMSDEEVPSDAYVTPEDAVVPVAPAPPPAPTGPRLDSDWGAQFSTSTEPPPPAAPDDEMRFAEDEGPSASTLAQPTPAAEPESMPVLDENAVQVDVTTLDTQLAQAVDPDAMVVTTGAPAEALGAKAPAWLTMEAAEAAHVPTETQWVTEGLADVPMPAAQAPVEAEVRWGAAGDAGTAGEAWAQAPSSDSGTWSDVAPEGAEGPGYDAGAYVADAAQGSAGYAAAGREAAAYAQDYAAGEAASGFAEAGASGSEAAAVEASGYADTAGYAEGYGAGEAGASASGSADATGGDVTAPVEYATGEDSSAWAVAPAGDALPVAAASETWPEENAGPIPPLEVPPMPAVQAAREDLPAPNPSGPELPIEVAPPEPAPPPAPSEGFTAMRSQRLVDLGAASGWVKEPSQGPFHMGTEGLAVTVAGEMLTRMTGLVAVVGGIEVKPEVRRKRGRPTAEPFGQAATQLQRVSGNGVVYLEPGKRRFFAVDLTDTNGASVDDDGAYLREEAVFAFEEPVSFENGHITGEGLGLELVHLKGTGKALLQLEGTMKAMPIPAGAPMVVPLKRLVGWFGRVTPRLMGFGGQGAVELKGDGYALLETPGA